MDVPQVASPPEEGRSARKRRAIIEAATTLFLRNGYQGTSMDEVAARAAVSKQTVYKNFADKEQLFAEIMQGVPNNSDQIVETLSGIFRRFDADIDLGELLVEVARQYLNAVLQPQVLRLRRLMIAEADRFPELARGYYQRGPTRGIEVLAAELRTLADRGLLRLDDARLAASQFAYLALGIPQDRALFCPGEQPGAADRERVARAAARVFLAAYGN